MSAPVEKRKEKKILVVIGATGNQGGSIIRTYLASPALQSEWHVRGVMRNTSSPASRSLASSGIEMVTASLDDFPSLVNAFEAAAVVFAVTDFWAPMQDRAVQAYAEEHGIDLATHAQAIEEKWGTNMALAASQVQTLERFVFSSLPPVRELSNGKLTHVRHFDGKANIVKMIERDHPDLNAKTSQIMIGSYMSNISPGSFFAPAYNPLTKRFEIVGAYAPECEHPYIDTPNSTGPLFWSLLREKAGTILLAFDELKSRAETCAILTEITGQPFVFVRRTPEAIAESAGPLGLEVAESGLWAGSYGFFGEKVEGWKEKLTWPKDLKVPVEKRSLGVWIEEQDWSSVLKQAQN